MPKKRKQPRARRLATVHPIRPHQLGRRPRNPWAERTLQEIADYQNDVQKWQQRINAQLKDERDALSIRVEPTVGSDAKVVFAAMCSLARRLQLNVITDFNTVHMCATPDDSPLALYQEWQRWLSGRKRLLPKKKPRKRRR